MKKVFLRKHIYSFSRQGLAENLLPISKTYKKKLAKASQSSAISQLATTKLRKSDTVEQALSHRGRDATLRIENHFLANSTINSSKKMKKSQERLVSHFLEKKIENNNITCLPLSITYSLPVTQFACIKDTDTSQTDFANNLQGKDINQDTKINLLKKENNLYSSLSIIEEKYKQEKIHETHLNLSRSLNSRTIQKRQPIDILFSVDQIRNEMSSQETQRKEYSQFLYQIRECRKIRYLYGHLSRSQLKKTTLKAKQLPGTTADNLLLLLESRLDCALQRCGFFPTIKAARQFITHKGVSINFKKVFQSGYQLCPGDVIRINPSRSRKVKKIEKQIQTFCETKFINQGNSKQVKTLHIDKDPLVTNKEQVKHSIQDDKKMPALQEINKILETTNNFVLNSTQKQKYLFSFFNQGNKYHQDSFLDIKNKLCQSLAGIRDSFTPIPGYSSSHVSPMLYKNILFLSHYIANLSSIPDFSFSTCKEIIKKQQKASALKSTISCQFACLLFPTISNISSRSLSNTLAASQPFATKQKAVSIAQTQREHPLIFLKEQLNLVNINEKRSLEKEELTDQMYRRLISLAKKANAFLKRHTQKKQVKSSNYNYINIHTLISCSQNFLYIIYTHLLYVQKKLLSFESANYIRKNNRVNSQTLTPREYAQEAKKEDKLNIEFENSLKKIKDSTTFYQKKSRGLHLEVSYHSLSAIFLYPPQKIYLPAIIDCNTIVKTLLRSKSR